MNVDDDTGSARGKRRDDARMSRGRTAPARVLATRSRPRADTPARTPRASRLVMGTAELVASPSDGDCRHRKLREL